MRAVNLIPADQRSGGAVGAGRSGGAAYAVLAVFGGFALLALLYGIAHHQVNSRQNEAASYSAKAQQAQAEVARLAPYTTFVAMRQQRKAAVEQLVNSRFDWAHTFHELARVIPSDASLSSLTGAIGGSGGSSGSSSSSSSSSSSPSSSSASSGSGSTSGSGSGTTTGSTSASAAGVTSATPAGSVPAFTIQGCATSQSVVAKTIDRLRLIDGVASVTLQSSTATPNATSGSAATGQCPAGDPAYQIQVTFQPLPSSTEIASAAKSTTVAKTGSGVAR